LLSEPLSARPRITTNSRVMLSVCIGTVPAAPTSALVCRFRTAAQGSIRPSRWRRISPIPALCGPAWRCTTPRLSPY